MARKFNSIAKILLADDDTTVHDVIRWACDNENIELVSTYTGEDVLDLAIIKRPDVIVLDIEMPLADGISTLKRLKSVEGIKDIPVLMLNARMSSAVKEECIRLGAKDVIYKTDCITDIADRLSGIANMEAATSLCRRTATMLKCTQRHMLRVGNDSVTPRKLAHNN